MSFSTYNDTPPNFMKKKKKKKKKFTKKLIKSICV